MKISKYRAKKKTVDNIVFHSTKEANYYIQLKRLKKAVNNSDRVVSIDFQPRYDYEIQYIANGKVYKKKGFYKADFKVIYADFRTEIIDVKGFKTAEYKRKKKIVEALYEIEIIEK